MRILEEELVLEAIVDPFILSFGGQTHKQEAISPLEGFIKTRLSRIYCRASSNKQYVIQLHSRRWKHRGLGVGDFVCYGRIKQTECLEMKGVDMGPDRGRPVKRDATVYGGMRQSHFVTSKTRTTRDP